ncbi:MAG: starch-binding protein [Bacteroidota bacterium]|nr:MAG: starch-binding protein [Bacteroidota bacterium]
MKNFTRLLGFAVLLFIGTSLIFPPAYAAVLPLPAGVADGINYINDNTVVLVLLAPGKTKSEVTGTFNSWGLLEMNKTPDGKRFWIQLNNLTAGQEYIYQYLVDGTIRISDPLAEKILDPYNDPLIPAANYPNLISWTDKTKGLASVFQTAQPEYQWQVTNFQGPLQHQLIVYELLIRDFTQQRTFQSVIDSMLYLKKLGINAIELLPVNEFDGNLGWGYNPSHYLAVDKMYGPKIKLKELIDVAHQNGMAVIIDMVYNHTMNQSPLASLYWNSTLSRPASNNPWYNETAPHQSTAWGNDFNHESQYTRDFFDMVNKFWIEEYKIDGFRFDFTKGFTQKSTSNDGGLSEYDASRIANITRMADKIWEAKDDCYIILEHWGQETEENELVAHGNGMLIWKKLHSEFTKALKGDDLYNQSFGGAQSDTRMIFSESHDEERIPYDLTQKFNSVQTMTNRMELGAAFLFTVPGPKMLWMFEEQGCNYSLFTCQDGSVAYNDGCKLAEKPFNWSNYMQDANRKELYNTYAGLLKLRKENPVFTLGYFEIDENGDAIANNGVGPVRQIRFKHASMDVVIIGNFGTTGASINPWFTKNGTWYNYFNKDYPTYVYSGQTSYYLAPGQWELFTSVKIDPSQIAAPTNLSATVSASNVSLTWVDNATNETGYQLERSLSETSGYSLIQTLPANSVSFSDNGLVDGKYYYRVRATGASSTFSEYSNVDDAQVGEPAGFTVHFKNTANWSDVNIYLFNWATKGALPGWNWPGVDMEREQGSSWYKYTIKESVQTGIVINNGGSLKTADLTRTTEGWYDFNTKQWYDACPGDCPTAPVPVLSVSPLGGSYENTVTVTLSATNSGVIRYTTDGSDPRSGLAYASSLTFTTTTRLRAIATNSFGESNEIDQTYTISYPKPVLTVNPTGKEFTGTLDVSLSATKSGVIKYTLNGNDPRTGSNYTGSISLTASTRLRAIASNANGYSNEIDEQYTLVENQCDTIFYYNKNNWSTVKIYLFNANGTGLPGWTWPGVNMVRLGTTNWYYHVNCETVNVGMVFNNGSGSQTGNLYSNAGWYYSNSQWYTSCPGECPGQGPVGLTLHCRKPSSWANVYIYYWSTSPVSLTTSWPGQPMTDSDGDGWYDYTLPGVSCANVIFSNKGASQTPDLKNICAESWYDNGWVSNPNLKNATEMEFSQTDLMGSPYPNPFTQSLKLSFNETDMDIDIRMVDLNGRTLFEQKANSGDGSVVLEPVIPSGMYILYVTTEMKNYRYKVVKQ